MRGGGGGAAGAWAGGTVMGESGWLRIVRGEAKRPAERLAAAGLRALSAAYAAALHIHLGAYRLGLARRTRLPALVVSVGNLTVGGTGKTTAALAVARWLWEHGKRVALLSRGYRGRGERKALVVSEGFGPLVTAEAAGDEAYMAARKLPNVSVLVGKDRRVTGRMAVDRLGANALVLDDGFQYQRLHRDVDIVLVDVLLPFGYDFLVPRGLLREPPDHLSRADAVWLTHSDLARKRDVDAVRARVESLAPQARIWEAVHAPVRLRRLDAEGEEEPDALRGRRVCALSSLGNPAAFARTLERMGASLVSEVRFPDHHVYRTEELQRAGEEEAADWVVTTEKDAVRLPASGDLGKPVWALEVELAGRPEGTSLGEEMSCLLLAKSGV
jgi:tetraacyldisaccharide 4'-kinase